MENKPDCAVKDRCDDYGTDFPNCTGSCYSYRDQIINGLTFQDFQKIALDSDEMIKARENHDFALFSGSAKNITETGAVLKDLIDGAVEKFVFNLLNEE